MSVLPKELMPKYYKAYEFRKAIDYIENKVKIECGFRSQEIITNRDIGDYCEFECESVDGRVVKKQI